MKKMYTKTPKEKNQIESNTHSTYDRQKLNTPNFQRTPRNSIRKTTQKRMSILTETKMQ